MQRTLEMLAEKDEGGGEDMSFADFLKEVFGELGTVGGISVDEKAMTGKFTITGEDWKALVTISTEKTGSVSITNKDGSENLASMKIDEKNLEAVLGAVYGFIASGLEGE